MAIVIIDGCELEIGDRERLNGIEAAQRLGIEIPHYCWHPALSVVGSCRMCLVETGTRDAKTGEISMMPKLVPACNTIVADGIVLVTDSEKVRQARSRVEESLLLRHPIDCPICDKAGECSLQDYHYKYGQDERRADIRPFTSRRRDVGEKVTLFVDRCIACTRCVRFAREVSGTCELMLSGRGAHEEIDVMPGFPLENNLSGNVVDLCPVGALGDRDFLYQQRVWFMQQHPGVCAGRATGCSIWVEENQDRIYRIKPRGNPAVNKWWICDQGRYGYGHVHSRRRLTRPLRRDGQEVVYLDWTGLPDELAGRLGEAGRLAAVLSPHLTVEEAYLLGKFIRGLDAQARLVLGPVPAADGDERFPGGFRISAEKCPNRRGVEAIIAHLTGRVTTFDEFLAELDDTSADTTSADTAEIRGVWLSGGYKTDWIDEASARRFQTLDLLVVQDLFPSPLSERAEYELPGAAFAERDGSYVNLADHLQSSPWAIRPPVGVRTEGSLYWELLKMEGMYNARAVLDEVAREISYFGAVTGPVPEGGIDLKVNLLADASGPNV
ncbi:MAG: NADH-quinone oxidoreductase subunit G [Planctomycetota bacterium]|jgi:NADH-quinone oxidoreductase subunit G